MRSILTFDILNQQHCMTNSIRVIWISIFLLFSVTGQAQYTLEWNRLRQVRQDEVD